MSKPKAQVHPKRGPGRPPDVNGDDTKVRIERAARHLFATHGYMATTTRMLAREVGLTPAALHHYFGRKRDLVLSVWRSTHDAQFNQMSAAVDAADSYLGKLHALLDQSFHARQSDRDVSTFVASMRQEARRSPELGKILEDDKRTAAVIRKIVDFGVRTGEVEADSAQAMRGAISAGMLGVTVLTAELTPSRIEAMVEGCKSLFDGTLLRPVVTY